jgi:DNA-binding transcriptional LysR family regulator
MGADFTRGLAIGAMVDIWETLLCNWLQRLRLHMPETVLQIEAATADQLIRKLLDGVIDLAVLFEPPQVPELEIRELGVINLVMVATRSGLTVEAACKSGYVLVDWGMSFSRNHARQFPDMPAPALHMNLGVLARCYLDRNDGAAYLPEQMAAVTHGGRRLYRVESAPLIERPLFAVFRTGAERMDAIRQALETMDDPLD